MPHRHRGYTIAEWLLLIVLAGLMFTAIRWYARTLVAPMQLMMSLAVSPDGQTVVVGYYDGHIDLWRAGRPRWVELGRHRACVNQAVFSPDGKFLATGAVDGVIMLWDLNTGKSRSLLPGLSASIVKLAFAPDGKTLAVARPNGAIEIRNVATGHIQSMIPRNPAPANLSVGYALGGKALVVTSGLGTVDLYDPVTGKPIASLPPVAAPWTSAALSPDGRTLAVASVGGGPSFDVILWDLDNRRIRTRLTGNTQPVLSMSFAPDGRTLATADGDLWLWDTATGQMRMSAGDKGAIMRTAFASRHATLVTCTTAGTVTLRDAATLRPIATIQDNLESGTSVPLFLAAMVAWIFLWTLVRNRRKRVCSECGRKYIASDKRPVVLCRRCYQRSLSPDPAAADLSRSLCKAGLWITLIMLLFLVNALSVRQGPAGMMPALWTFGMFLLSAVGVFALLILLLVVRVRWTMKRLAREPNALRLARKVSKHSGTLVRLEPITLWSSGDEDFVPFVRGCLETCKRRLEPLVGERFEPREPLRILVFARRGEFTAFCRRMLIMTGSLDGFFLNPGQRTIIFTLESEPNRIAYPERTLCSTLAFYFLESKKGFLLPYWLNQGLGYAAAADETPGRQQRLERKMLLALERGRALGVAELFQISARALLRMARNNSSHEQFARFMQWSWQALSVVEYLAGPGAPADRRARMHAFLNDLQKKDKHAEVFERHFHYGYEQLLHDWQSWVRRHVPGEHEPPPDAIQQALCGRIIPAAGDPHVKISERVIAIREMGRTGYVVGADVLIEILRRREELLKRDTVWALEAISGRALGDDVPAWEAWWASLPPELRADHEAAELAEPDRSGMGTGWPA